MTKKVLAVLLCVLLVVILAVGCGQRDKKTAPEAKEKKVYTIKLGHDQMEGTPHHAGAALFKEKVEAQTNGKIQVEIFPAQQLGTSREMIEGLQLGSVEAVFLPAAPFTGFNVAIGALDLPMLFLSPEVAFRVLDGPVGDKILKKLEKSGIIGAAFGTSGFKQFTGDFPIHQPGDYRGKKIRVMANPMLIAQFEAMGASAIKIDFHELYNALQQGAVDGQENPLATIYNMKFYEVQDYVTISNHGFLGYIFAFSKKWFDTLPADYQKIIVNAAKEAAIFHRAELFRFETEKYLPTIEQATTVIRLTDEQRSAFKEATRPAYQKFIDLAGVEGEQLLNELFAEIDKHK